MIKKQLYVAPATKTLEVRIEGVFMGSFDGKNGTEKYGEDPDIDL